jgi:hypothetical protein
MLEGLLAEGLAKADAHNTKAGSRRMTVVWLTITDGGPEGRSEVRPP